MREILFRGQIRRFGEKVNMAGEKQPSKWVYGGIFPCTGVYSIIYDTESCEKYTVYSDTVGQYTGLKDKNGKRIFEGDIVKTQPFSDRPYSKRAKFKRHIGVVEHKICQKYVSEWFVRVDDYNGFACCNWSAFYDCEVIGNIHDNPELMKGESNG